MEKKDWVLMSWSDMHTYIILSIWATARDEAPSRGSAPARAQLYVGGPKNTILCSYSTSTQYCTL